MLGSSAYLARILVITWGAVRWGEVGQGSARQGSARLGKARSGMELATAAKRLAAVVYPMGSGTVRRCKARYGQVGLGAVWYGASSGRPVGNSWSSSRCGAAGLGCGLAGRGLVRHGLVR